MEKYNGELLHHDEKQSRCKEEALHEQNNLLRSSAYGELPKKYCNILLPTNLTKALYELVKFTRS